MAIRRGHNSRGFTGVRQSTIARWIVAHGRPSLLVASSLLMTSGAGLLGAAITRKFQNFTARFLVHGVFSRPTLASGCVTGFVAHLSRKEQQVLPVLGDGGDGRPWHVAGLEQPILPTENLERRSFPLQRAAHGVHQIARIEIQVPRLVARDDAHHVMGSRQTFELHQIKQARALQSPREPFGGTAAWRIVRRSRCCEFSAIECSHALSMMRSATARSRQIAEFLARNIGEKVLTITRNPAVAVLKNSHLRHKPTPQADPGSVLKILDLNNPTRVHNPTRVRFWRYWIWGGFGRRFGREQAAQVMQPVTCVLA